MAAVGTALLLAGALAILPGMSGGKGIAKAQEPQSERLDEWQQQIEKEIAELQAKLEQKMTELQEHRVRTMDKHAQEMAALTAERHARLAAEMAEQQARHAQDRARWVAEAGPLSLMTEDGSGWLGVSIDEVTAEKAKELKLSPVHGVYISDVSEDSPAAKAGLKAGDVITEYNGQRVVGTMQFRRLVRETPAGRAVTLNVWRDGRAQTLSATLGSAEDRIIGRLRVEPNFDFRMEMPRIEVFSSRTPRLGIQADDISGQLGAYFGVPEGEGVLVREVNSGSPAEKAGIKAGDVITQVDGERVRTTSELRSELRERREKKSVTIGVIRNRTATSLNVEIEQPKPPEGRARYFSRRITL